MLNRSGSKKKHLVSGKKERWLLTRKTWRYMTDAGRPLLPQEGTQNQLDVTSIEANFQIVCNNEPTFVLWRRKNSLPESLAEKRLMKTELKASQTSHLGDFQSRLKNVASEKFTVPMLLKYLNNYNINSYYGSENHKATYKSVESFSRGSHRSVNENTLLEKIRQYAPRSRVLSNIVIDDKILHDQYLLERIFNELKNLELSNLVRLQNHSKFTPVSSKTVCYESKVPVKIKHDKITDLKNFNKNIKFDGILNKNNTTYDKCSLIVSVGTQTDAIHKSLIELWNADFKQNNLLEVENNSLKKKSSLHRQRSSSLNNEDVSESVSNTIKRYFLIARKKSKTSVDRFRSLNYDKNLRNIKSKSLDTLAFAIDNETMKGTQTNDNWTEDVLNSPQTFAFIDRGLSSNCSNEKQFSYSAPSSPSVFSKFNHNSTGLLKASTHFLSNLLGRGTFFLQITFQIV